MKQKQLRLVSINIHAPIDVALVQGGGRLSDEGGIPNIFRSNAKKMGRFAPVKN